MAQDGNGPPPDKFTAFAVQDGSPDDFAAHLSDLWQQGYQGPYVTVQVGAETWLAIGAYSEKK